MLTNSKIALSVTLVLATASAAVAAPKLNTTQIAHDLLGPSQRVYYQDLTTHANQPHLKIDKLGAGDFIFVDSGVPGSNPAHSYEEKGLLIAIDRPPNASGFIFFVGGSQRAEHHDPATICSNRDVYRAKESIVDSESAAAAGHLRGSSSAECRRPTGREQIVGNSKSIQR